MRFTSVVVGLVISTTIFVCVEPALGQRVPRPFTDAHSPAPAASAPIPFPWQDTLARLDDLEAQVATLQTALAAETAARQNADMMLATVIIQHMDLLEHFSRDGDEITISGANLHIVNGTGTTDGPTDGLGNLIIGYNEERGFNDLRTGSHMLVVGKENNYSGFGGIVVGFNSSTSGQYSSVSGGTDNRASGQWSSVSGGFQRMAIGIYEWVAGVSFLTGVPVTGPR